MDIKDIKEKMHNKGLYYCNDEELMREQLQLLDQVYEFNQIRPSYIEERQEMMKKMFARVGENCYIESPFHASWGGKHVHLGNDVYINFNLSLVDDSDIYIGDGVLIAPNVTIACGTHPIRPDIRCKQAQYNLPIYIGNRVWIGANCVIMPGVKIGENSVIGAGSIVTKDVPANVIAVGNPCRILREIDDNDMKYYYQKMVIDMDQLF